MPTVAALVLAAAPLCVASLDFGSPTLTFTGELLDSAGRGLAFDGEWATVGATERAGLYLGSVTWFKFDGDSFQEHSEYAYPDVPDDPLFGRTCDILGEWTVCGAHWTDVEGVLLALAPTATPSGPVGSADDGEVRVFKYDVVGDAWDLHQVIPNPSPSTCCELFGRSLDLAEVNGDIFLLIAKSVNAETSFSYKLNTTSGDFEEHQEFSLDGGCVNHHVAVDGFWALFGCGTGPERATLWKFNTGTDSWEHHSTFEDATGSGHFGFFVDIDGDWAAVSERYNGGRVFVYKYTSGTDTWALAQTILSPGGGDDGFGWSVEIDLAWGSNGAMVIGARYLAQAFAYELSGGTWTLEQTLTGPSGSQFGDLVRLQNGMLGIGAPKADDDAGMASFYGSPRSIPNPGSVGDPILVDFAGHRFIGGARGRTEYLLYRSQDEAEAITMTTGVVRGAEQGFFAVAMSVQRAGCGSLSITAIETDEHKAEISGDACMTARIARGDSGMVLVPIGAGGDSGSVLAVYPHQQGDSPAFLNMRLLATTPEFRAGCTGMLCNEAHGDVEA